MLSVKRENKHYWCCCYHRVLMYKMLQCIQDVLSDNVQMISSPCTLNLKLHERMCDSLIHTHKKRRLSKHTVYQSTFINIPTLSFMFPFPGRKRLHSKVPNVEAAKNWSCTVFCGSLYTIITKDHVERKSSAKNKMYVIINSLLFQTQKCKIVPKLFFFCSDAIQKHNS